MARAVQGDFMVGVECPPLVLRHGAARESGFVAFDVNGNWDVIERFCALVAGQADIWYATNIEICEYILAYRRLVWSVERDSVLNPTSTEIYGFTNGRPCVIPAAQR